MSYESRRKEESDYTSDVHYEIWRSGGNPDRVSDDRIMDRFHDGYSAEECANSELRREREARQARREQEEQEQAEYDRSMEEHRRYSEEEWQEESGDK